MTPIKLQQKICQRIESDSLRKLGNNNQQLIDFSSNDYLGFSKLDVIFENTYQEVFKKKSDNKNGATGSRLLSGNSNLYSDLEVYLAEKHQSEKALIFNSGYTANLGFFSCVPQRGDIILYDELIHASIRDGMQLSNAKYYKFKHNDVVDLEKLILKFKQENTTIYIVTESVFSMDGDTPNLQKISEITKRHNAYLVVDEAHALGVYGLGLIEQLNLKNEIFARIITFGKGLGCHGAVILGSQQLIQFLVNFCRPFIYTTGLSPHSIANIKIAYQELLGFNGNEAYLKLKKNITYFTSEIERLGLNFIPSNSAIHCCIVSGNENVKKTAKQLQISGFDVKPILSPTVSKGKERLRVCLHSYNSFTEIDALLGQLNTFLKA